MTAPQSMIQRTEANPSTCRIWEATICPIIAPAINPVMPIKSRQFIAEKHPMRAKMRAITEPAIL